MVTIKTKLIFDEICYCKDANSFFGVNSIKKHHKLSHKELE